MANIKNIRFVSLGPNRRRFLISAAIILIIVIVAGILLYQKNHKHPRLAAETRTASLSQQYLFAKNYNSYQLQLSSSADDYTSLKRYSDAERVLNEIIANVPSDKVTADTYRSFWYLYQQNGDAANRKKYAKLAADKLKAEGQTQAAAAFEADANGK
jgi:hypothetical protein